MLALRKSKAGPGLDLAESDCPVPGHGEVLVEVAAAGICGSDLHIDDASRSYGFVEAALPVTLGHEFSGVVVAHGTGLDGEAPPVGALVVGMPSVVCGCCRECLSGDVERCGARRGIGMTRDGAFAPLVAVPVRNCLPVPDGLAPELAALAEPLTVAWHAVRRGGVCGGARVLVLGPGTIGQGVALMARRAGAASVAVAGRDDAPRLATVAALGFEDLFDLAGPDAGWMLSNFAGDGFDVVFEATGAAAAIQMGLEVLRPGGVFVAAGIHEAPAPFDVTMLVRRELDIRGSYRAPLRAWPRVLAMLARRPDDFEPMVTRRMPLAQGLDAFRLAHGRGESKILLIP